MKSKEPTVLITATLLFCLHLVTTIRMAQVQELDFRALLQRFGFSQDALQAIIDNGIRTTTDLIGLVADDIENIVKIARSSRTPPMLVSYLAQKRLSILTFWVNRRQRLGETITAPEFTVQVSEAAGRLMAFEDQEDETTAVKAPSEFTAGTKWKAFKEGAIAFFNSQKGRGQIPLAYVIREQDVPDPNAVYINEHQRIIAITPLQGIEYGEDNGKVFDHLKSWTLKGPAWTWMRQYNSLRDGRRAWLALVAHFEGDAQRDRVKDQAYSSIAATKYHGEKKRFSFETYVTIHQEAYEDLEQYGEHVSEEKRVRDLLQGIKDPSINAAKEAILANANLRSNFTSAVTHLATSLQLNLSIQDSRNIGSITSGSGRGHRGSRGGRGGRGRGRDGGNRSRGRGGRNIYLGSYSPDQWRKLSGEDRKRVIEGRAKSAEQQQLTGQQGSRISALISADQDMQSAITLPTAIADVNASPGTQIGDKRSNPDAAGSHMSRRRINRILTGPRHTSNRPPTSAMDRRVLNVHTNQVHHSTCELDSHADTCVAGPNTVILEYTDQMVSVSAFSDQFEVMKDIPIGTAATAYDDPNDGTTTILVIHQALLMNDVVQTTLLCPNQLRSHGLIVDDVPVHLSHHSQPPSTHSIYVPIDDFRIPLSLSGVISLIETRTPTQDELDTCQWVTLTSEANWNPHSATFQENEYRACLTPELQDRTLYRAGTTDLTYGNIDTDLADISESLEYTPICIAALTSLTQRSTRISPETLSQRWGIGLEEAKQTLKVTTQKGMRQIVGPIERRLRTRMAHLRYKQLSGRHGRFYTDTFFASIPTTSGKSMAQLYTNDIHFMKVYPMTSKSETSESLLSLIHHVGIPSSLHSDYAKEIREGKFNKLCQEYHIPLTTTEPYSPWQNRAEGAIREMKRHVRRKMHSRSVPQSLWDFCVKWSCDVRAKSVHKSFDLEGRTPYEVVMGDTPDISSLMD